MDVKLQADSIRSLLGFKHVLVVGDVMADRYIWGQVNRISPEAPVPIVEVEREEIRLGGAANVAANLSSFGVRVSLSGIIGADESATVLKQICIQSDIDPAGLVTDPNRPTTTKTRVLGNAQQMLRLDRENNQPIEPETEDELLAAIKELPPWDALVIEDYDKGVLSETLIQQLIQLSNRFGSPVLVDPKFRNFFSYTGCTWFKPNLKELCTAKQYSGRNLSVECIKSLCIDLRELMPHTYSLVTMSERGLLLVDPSGKGTHFKAHVREIRDVSGAGDAVIAALTAGLLLGFTAYDAAAWANLAGGLACEELGVLPVSLDRLIHEFNRLERQVS